MRFRDISIKHKQVLIMTLICVVSLAMAGGAFLGLQVIEFRRSSVNEMAALAQVVGDNTKAAISFDSAENAAATLAALATHPQVLYAAVILKNETLFADYRREGTAEDIRPDMDMPIFAEHIDNSQLRLTRGIRLNGHFIGHIYILADLTGLHARVAHYTEILIIILLAALLVSLMMGSLLQRVISNPILRLAETSQTVTEKNDYSIRAVQHSEDELGHLIASFNDMLSRIEMRDAELIRSRDELASLSSQNELLLNAAGEGICGIDQKGMITFANPAAAQMLDRPLARIVGLHIHEIFHDPEHRSSSEERSECVSCRPLLDGQWHHLDCTTFVRKNGEAFPAEVISTPIIEDAGQHKGTVLTFKDISKRVAAEKTLKTYARRLSESNEELQKFAYVASHDLQEPLRKVRAFGDRLLERYRPDLDERGQLYIERMQKAAERMQNLVHDLLLFSRITQHERPLRPVNLNEVIEGVLSDLELRIEQTKANIEVEPLPTLEADASQLRQLFQNLISNAIKFQNPGTPPTVKLSAVSEPGPPDETGMNRTFWRIVVRDEGLGFENKYSNRIFEVFQRLQGQSDAEGTGIGLAICRKIVERLGGTIHANSEPGKGSTFTIILPETQNATAEVVNG